jgi:crotonobetainyl-CoA:carnitine CoA-transferase CaiB-like acyl-CoA transferase
VFNCTGVDRWIAISITNDQEWTEMCGVLDDHMGIEYARRFATSIERRLHENDIGKWIAEKVRRFDAWELTNLLQRRSVPASVVQSVQDLVELDPHISAQHFTDISDRSGRVSYRSHLQPARIDSKVPVPDRAPVLGEHNEEVLIGKLGLAENEFVQLILEGVIA